MKIVGPLILIGAITLGGCQQRSPQTVAEIVKAIPACPSEATVICGINPAIAMTTPVCPYADTLVGAILSVEGTWNIQTNIVCFNSRQYEVRFLVGDLFDQAETCHKVAAALSQICPKAVIGEQ